MKVYLGADHRGFNLKNKIKILLEKWNISHEDMGAYELDKDDDYTLYAEKVASVVSKEEKSFGILVCGSGVGVDVIANKFDGIRASIGKEPGQVKAGRKDDNMNILVLAADFTREAEAREMLQTFLHTKFAGLSRYKRRLQDITRIEENN